ncbi:glycosyltransferase family 4 protein [Clostridium sp. C2-6-12]|uniref:glycosyltransferase family 4 protein n=1 Tax=Clostridium sp. C2-6-12 TaxID=2698832 RepID=UPI00136BCE07|nr:glycosyltransferase family 4 protein [Clostridium sp. C2-6-12]
MKIAILHSGDLENLSLGGVDQYIKNIIRYSNDDEIVVYGTSPHKMKIIGKKYKSQLCGKVYTYIPISDDKRHPLCIFYLFNIIKYLSSLKKFDVIYAQRIEYSLPFIFSKSRKKLIQIVHGSSKYTTLNWGSFKTKVYCLMERISIRTASKTLVVLLRKEFGIPYYKAEYSKYKDKIFYGKIPVNTTIFKNLDKDECRRKLGLPIDGKIIMYGGRVEDNPKRIFILVDILNGLLDEHKNIYLMLVGDGSDREKLKSLIAKKGLERNYIDIGYIEDREILVNYLNSSDININLSRFEGTCTSSLEAVACGVPVVSTNSGDINLFVHDNCNGIVVNNTTNDEIIKTSIQAINRIFNGEIKMTNDFLKYECSFVVRELYTMFN